MEFDKIQDAMANKPKHPREVAIEKRVERLRNDPKEAARMLMHYAYALSHRRNAHTYLPDHTLIVEALKMGAMALEKEAEDD